MSFKCEFCNKVQEIGSSPVMVVVEKRHRVYEEVKDGNRTINPGGRGWEIVKEKKACAKCIKRMEKDTKKAENE